MFLSRRFQNVDSSQPFERVLSFHLQPLLVIRTTQVTGNDQVVNLALSWAMASRTSENTAVKLTSLKNTFSNNWKVNSAIKDRKEDAAQRTMTVIIYSRKYAVLK